MLEPPSRSSLWRFKYTDPNLAPFRKFIRPNYDDMNLNCGGKKVKWSGIKRNWLQLLSITVYIVCTNFTLIRRISLFYLVKRWT